MRPKGARLMGAASIAKWGRNRQLSRRRGRPRLHRAMRSRRTERVLEIYQRGHNHDMAGDDVVVLCADHKIGGGVVALVKSCGVSCAVARDGHHASRLLRRRTVHLLITDRLFPLWPGLASWFDLKLEYRDLGVVAIVEPTIVARRLGWWMGADATLARPPLGRGWEWSISPLHPAAPMEGHRPCAI